jgi:hypothetical protein
MAISSKKIANALISSIRGGSNIEDLSKSFKNFMEINHLSPLLPSVLKNLERELSEIQNKKNSNHKNLPLGQRSIYKVY